MRRSSKKRCSIPDCGQILMARGWCHRHYYRWQRHGDPLGGRISPGEADRYYREVVLTYEGDDCLLWPFATSAGYGVLARNGQNRFVSLLACEAVNGPKPTPTHQAAHSCGKGRSGCVTKGHLSWKTPKENQADRIIHGTAIRGEQITNSKLTADQVREIYALKDKADKKHIAAAFGVSKGHIQRIHAKESWGWLLEDAA